jgi:hypothetical protein
MARLGAEHLGQDPGSKIPDPRPKIQDPPITRLKSLLSCPDIGRILYTTISATSLQPELRFNMSTAAPEDGGSNPERLKDKLKHPFDQMREKFRDTKLYDVKVGLSHKKYVCKMP